MLLLTFAPCRHRLAVMYGAAGFVIVLFFCFQKSEPLCISLEPPAFLGDFLCGLMSFHFGIHLCSAWFFPSCPPAFPSRKWEQPDCSPEWDQHRHFNGHDAAGGVGASLKGSSLGIMPRCPLSGPQNGRNYSARVKGGDEQSHDPLFALDEAYARQCGCGPKPVHHFLSRPPPLSLSSSSMGFPPSALFPAGC